MQFIHKLEFDENVIASGSIQLHIKVPLSKESIGNKSVEHLFTTSKLKIWRKAKVMIAKPKDKLLEMNSKPMIVN